MLGQLARSRQKSNLLISPPLHALAKALSSLVTIIQSVLLLDFVQIGLVKVVTWFSLSEIVSWIIPDICHGRHGHVRVIFFWPV